MRALSGRIPRALPNHRTPEGAAYGDYCRAMAGRLKLGREANPTLREAGLCTIELARLAVEAERVRLKPNAKAQYRRLRREQRALRFQLVALERRLEELAGTARPNSHDHLDNLLGDLHGE